MKEQGHVLERPLYHSELAKDILSVAFEKQKKEDYKKLEAALKENEKAQRAEKEEAKAKAAKEEEEQTSPLGLGGWLGILLVVALLVGVLTNFGFKGDKKVSTR